ncbi:hypothetical protein RW26_14730 [Aeromonas sp. L_1B5_3]|nr:hypothetical protein RW26_14730 [Aeromonas sp. L_1B5_3]
MCLRGAIRPPALFGAQGRYRWAGDTALAARAGLIQSQQAAAQGASGGGLGEVAGTGISIGATGLLSCKGRGGGG